MANISLNVFLKTKMEGIEKIEVTVFQVTASVPIQNKRGKVPANFHAAQKKCFDSPYFLKLLLLTRPQWRLSLSENYHRS